MLKIGKISSLFTSEFRQGFLMIFSSKILIALITFLTTPIVARLFSPEDYGMFAILNSVAVIIALFSNLTLPTSLVVINDDQLKRTTTGIVTNILILHFILMVFGLVILFSAPIYQYVYDLLGIGVTFHVLIALLLFSLFEAFSQIFANINIREKDFKRNITVNVLDNFSIKGSSLLIGFFRHMPFGLFYAELIGKGVNILTQLSFRNFRLNFLDFKKLGNFRLSLEILREQRHYPLYTFPVSLMSRFSGQLILWVFAIAFSKQSVGHFTMGLGLLSIPLMLLANSLQPVIIKKLDEDRINGLANSLLSLVIKLGMLAGVVYSFLYFISPWFISIYLGEKWIDSVEFIQLLCFPFALQLVSNSLDGAFIVYKRQKAQFYFKIFFLVLLTTSIYFLSISNLTLHSVVLAYGAVLVVEEISKIAYLIWITRYVRSN